MDYQLGPGPLQVDQNTIDEKIKGDIGIVENGDVATHAIPSGYYVIWKGDLYVAKTDISSGTTLSTSNLTAKPNGLGAEVAALRSEAIAATGITLSAANVTSDDYILSLDPGVYCIAGNKSTYLPTRYGTLTKYNSGSSTYGYCMIVSAEGGHYYIRHFNGNTWHENEWRELALKSSVDTLNSNLEKVKTNAIFGTAASGTVNIQITYSKHHILFYANHMVSFIRFPDSGLFLSEDVDSGFTLTDNNDRTLTLTRKNGAQFAYTLVVFG